MFSITRIYSDGNGDSHFEDVEIELREEGNGELSEIPTATHMLGQSSR